VSPQPASAANLVANPGFETDGTDGMPSCWEKSGWGDNDFTFATVSDAHSGTKAMKVTLAAIRNARGLASLEAALNVEYRLVSRLFEDGEFPEGVRALLVDKDRKPKWSPPDLAGVDEKLVRSYLAPLPAGEELGLAIQEGNR